MHLKELHLIHLGFMPRSTLFEVELLLDDAFVEKQTDVFLPPETPLWMKYTESKHGELTEQEVMVIVQSVRRVIADDVPHVVLLGVRLKPIHPIFIAVPGAYDSRPISLYMDRSLVAEGNLTAMLEPHFT